MDESLTTNLLHRVVDAAGFETLVAGHPGVRSAPNSPKSREAVTSILKATSALVLVEGIRGITTNEIARCAGVSTATLYRYFSDFEGIFVTLGSRMWQEDLSAVAQRLHELPHDAAPEAWATALCSGAEYGSHVWDERLAVTRAMDAVPSMRPVLNIGYDVGGRLIAEALVVKRDARLSRNLLGACGAVFRMLRSGPVLSSVDGSLSTAAHSAGYRDSATVLIAGLMKDR